MKENEVRDELIAELKTAIGRHSIVTQEFFDKIVSAVFFIQGEAYTRGYSEGQKNKCLNQGNIRAKK